MTKVYFSDEFSIDAHSAFKWHLMIGDEVAAAVVVVVAAAVVVEVVAAAVVVLSRVDLKFDAIGCSVRNKMKRNETKIKKFRNEKKRRREIFSVFFQRLSRLEPPDQLTNLRRKKRNFDAGPILFCFFRHVGPNERMREWEGGEQRKRKTRERMRTFGR